MGGVILVRIRRLGLGLVAGLVLVSCSSQTDSALADAQQVCTNLGYESGTRDDSTESSDSGTDGWDAAKWAEVADDFNEEANRAARAAREDRRWDKLSNAVTDFQALTELTAKAKDETLPQTDRDDAQAQIDRLGPQEVVRVLDQECRKAQAQ
ncbi:hypothetical protein [Streptomyces sp. CC219B]|uniref:hypothetical protein n=1 Tax=Streptomyces sp. CC219B TaxID=3044574 RepID=UPI0024A962D8|nr:hypothetical protein [Streptomyces sp. CC219B]